MITVNGDEVAESENLHGVKVREFIPTIRSLTRHSKLGGTVECGYVRKGHP